MKETIEIILSCTFFLILAFILSLVLMTLRANFAVVFKGEPDLCDKWHEEAMKRVGNSETLCNNDGIKGE